MVFNDMLFEKSTNVNNNTEQIDKNTNTKSKQTKSEHTPPLTSSSISYSSISAIYNNKDANNSHSKHISVCGTRSHLVNSQPLKALPSQPSVGSGYFGLGIPKSPSFHSGLDLLADDYDDNDKIIEETTVTALIKSENSCGGGASISGSIGSKFKFTNIEEIKAKLSNSSFSTISTVKKAYNKMPALQPQSHEVNSSTKQSLSSSSSNSSAVLVTTSSSPSSSSSASLSQQQQVVKNTGNSGSMSMASSSSNTDGLTFATTTNSISSTTSSIVSTLAQHFNAATSATQLLTTASSTLGSNSKSPVSAATAIKNILNATKNVGTGGSNNTSSAGFSASNAVGQGQYNAVSSTTTTAASSSSTSPPLFASETAVTINNSSSVTQTIGSSISISLGVGNASDNSIILTRSNGDNLTQKILQNNFNISGGNSSNLQYQNGEEDNNENPDKDFHNINNQDGSVSGGSGPFVTQTLQQISGSPGRARDRNVFHTPTSSAAVQLPLLRGF